MAEKARVNKDKKAAKSPKAAKPATKPKPQAPAPKAAVVAVSKGKCLLSKSELAEVRQLLLQKRQALLGDLSGMEATAMRSRQGHAGDLSHMPTHLADLGSDNYEQEFTLGLLESERMLLIEIDQALERIDRGTYGICLGTGEPIGKSRLMARPWAKYTIEYARLIEKGLAKPVEELQAAQAGEEDEHVKDRPADEEDEDEEEDEDADAADDEEDEKERDDAIDDE